MKQSIMLALAVSMVMGASAQLKMPAPSSTQTIRQDFGMGQVELTYSRPNAKGRTVFGNLVPWGKIWRTGANSATRIKFTDVVEMGGKQIDTGSYVIYTIPQKGEWEIILNKGLSNWGVDGYKTADDVVRFKVPSTKATPKVETFTMQIVNVGYEKCELQILWENTAVSVPISTNVKARLQAQISQAMASDKKPYWQAANFYYEWEKDMNKALPAVEGAIEGAEKAGQKPFYMYMLKAKIQKEKGDKAGAKASAQRCVEMAKLAKNADYEKMGTEFIAEMK